MKNRIRTHPWAVALLGLTLSLVAVGAALAAGNIDPTNKWAWGANAGWINFAPDNGGVAVFSDHLEGYAWGENIGWLRLGTYTGGGSHTYVNTAPDNYGVNNDGVGHLSGYAWGANVGWINFDPDGTEQVTIDPATGDFNGYAWGENVGWIHLRNASPAYKVNTAWRPSSPPGGNIDASNKWAWSTNAGWINFAPDIGGVSVTSDHLEGDAWGENIGWLRLGTYTGGAAHTYANDAAGTYGVNNDGVGNLSGYAWGTNVGWINFAPANSDGGVWADPVTGDFEGYAWGENVGWIHFRNISPAYKVTTGWHGDLLAAYQNNIAAIIAVHRTGPAASGGLTVANSTFLQDAGDGIIFLQDAGDGIIFGHNNVAFDDDVTAGLPSDVASRWARIWQLDVNDGEGASGGQVTLTFDISEAGGSGTFNDTSSYFLLKRPTGGSSSFTTVTVVNTSVFGDQVTFTVDVSELGSEFTLGASLPTAVAVQNLTARRGTPSGNLTGVLALGLLVAARALTAAVWRRTQQG